MSFTQKSKLPRLPREFYQGHAAVLWTHCTEKRATGWLDESFHRLFREVLLHASHRYALVCPCYVLMPDHWHIVWLGLTENSDQWLATAFLRKYLTGALGPTRLQDRAHDRVLRENERHRSAFENACAYVRQNPERASLCANWREWSHFGASIPGYPDLDPRHEDFWDKFWKVHNRLVENKNLSALTRGATSPSSPLREERDQASPCACAQSHADTHPS